jgi:iron-sulfur cluster repair protein YtfE (RIC family)
LVYKNKLGKFSNVEEKLITRQNWKSHPEYHKSGAYFLIEVHDSFRSNFKEIKKLLQEKSFESAKKKFSKLEEHLDNHHYIEESKMFPNLEKKMKKLTDENIHLVGELKKDHKEMNKSIEEIEKLFKDKKYEEILEKWINFTESMQKHLREEEDIAMPFIIKFGIEL